MPVTVSERPPPESPVKRRFDSERVWVIAGTTDRDEAETELLAQSPSTDTNSAGGSLFRDDHEVTPIATEGGHGGIWEGRVHYGPLENPIEPPQTGDSLYAFDLSGETTHITTSKETVEIYHASGTLPNDLFHQAIGVGDDGSIEGTDVIAPVLKFTVTEYFAHDTLVGLFGSVLNYAAVLSSLVGRTNDAGFYGRDAGEVLFVGASGSRRGSDADWEITFHFMVSPNLTDLSVGEITGIAKEGWEYLWVQYETTEDATNYKLVTKAFVACVERVYDEGDFSLIGIGT